MATEAPAAPAPAAPAVTIDQGKRERIAAAAAQTEIRVSDLPKGDIKGDPTIKPPKTGSARAKMFEELEKTAGLTKPAPKAAPAKKTETTQVTEPAESDKAPEAEPAAEPEARVEAPPGTGVEPTAAEPGKKISPWKLVDQYKARASTVESENLKLQDRLKELEKAVVPKEKIDDYEKQIQTMREDLRYFNAEKYDPDVIKANNDYVGAWNRAMSELSELTVTDPANNSTRPVNAEDLLELVNLPLQKAREVANGVFGDFADDIMAHRKEIKQLFEARQAKLDELKKNGEARDQQRTQQYQNLMKQVTETVQKVYNEVQQEVLNDPKIGPMFKPREGDTEWNERLEKGFKLVDEAYAANATDPRLTPEQRREIIRKHTAVRNRAAAYQPLLNENRKLKSRLTELEKKLSEYQESEPTTAGRTATGTAAPPSAREAMLADLRKRAGL